MSWYDKKLGAERDTYDTNLQHDGRMGDAEYSERDVELIKKGQFNTGFLLGVEFGFKQGEKGHNFEHALDEARKALAPKTEKRGA